MISFLVGMAVGAMVTALCMKDVEAMATDVETDVEDAKADVEKKL